MESSTIRSLFTLMRFTQIYNRGEMNIIVSQFFWKTMKFCVEGQKIADSPLFKCLLIKGYGYSMSKKWRKVKIDLGSSSPKLVWKNLRPPRYPSILGTTVSVFLLRDCPLPLSVMAFGDRPRSLSCVCRVRGGAALPSTYYPFPVFYDQKP